MESLEVGKNKIILKVILHADGELVITRSRGAAEVVFMRRGEAVICAYFPAIHPQARLPVWPLQSQQEPLAFPVSRNLNVALIPSHAGVALFRLQPEGHLDIARLAILGVFRRCEPGLVHDVAGPFSLDGDIVADALRRQRAG